MLPILNTLQHIMFFTTEICTYKHTYSELHILLQIVILFIEWRMYNSRPVKTAPIKFAFIRWNALHSGMNITLFYVNDGHVHNNMNYVHVLHFHMAVIKSANLFTVLLELKIYNLIIIYLTMNIISRCVFVIFINGICYYC